MEGWLKLHRQLMDKPVWACATAEQKVVFITLLMLANHADNKWQWKGVPYQCKAGQMVTGLEKLSERCGVSVHKVRTALERLTKYGVITKEASNGGTLITVVNWGIYQCGGGVGDKPTASEGQDHGKQAATNKNEKKEKNLKKHYGGGKKRFVNFEARDYDYEAYEKKEFERITKLAEAEGGEGEDA